MILAMTSLPPFPLFIMRSPKADSVTSSLRLTMHNVNHMLSLMARVRAAIVEDRYPAFCVEFFANYFPNQPPPGWAVGALKGVGIKI